MRSHNCVHRATTKYFSNSFVFKSNIEKEGLPKRQHARLGRALSDSNSSINYFHFPVFSVIWGICFSLKANPNGKKNIAFWHTFGTGDAPALRNRVVILFEGPAFISRYMHRLVA